jgi:hypothetical protein
MILVRVGVVKSIRNVVYSSFPEGIIAQNDLTPA